MYCTILVKMGQWQICVFYSFIRFSCGSLQNDRSNTQHSIKGTSKNSVSFPRCLCKSLQDLHLHYGTPLKTEVFRGALNKKNPAGKRRRKPCREKPEPERFLLEKKGGMLHVPCSFGRATLHCIKTPYAIKLHHWRFFCKFSVFSLFFHRPDR